jgi:hypothetical protein
MNHQGFPFQQRFSCEFAQQQRLLCPKLLPVPVLVQTVSGIGPPIDPSLGYGLPTSQLIFYLK